MNAIATLLEMKEKAYHLMVFDTYYMWCELNSVNDNDTQRLLSNPLLHKWFMGQYSQLEIQFYADYKKLSSKQSSRNSYDNYVKKIGEYYPPKFLIKSIRKASRLIQTSKYNLN